MAAKGEPPLIDVDAEELVFELRLNSIPSREAITSLMPTIVEMGFMLNTVSMCSFILYQFIVNCTVLYSYSISYYIFHTFYIVRLQVQLQDQLLDIPCILYCMVTRLQLLHIPCILYCMVTSVVTRPVITYSMHSILHSYKCGYKTGYYIFHAFYIVRLQVWLQDHLLVCFTVKGL